MSIPLTIDWLTLAWLKLRLSLWWRRKRLPLLALGLTLLLCLAGCVPVTRFEEAQSAAQVEMAGRQLAEQQLQREQAESQALRARLASQDATLAEKDQALAQAELDGAMQLKQRGDAEGMVEQLRGELARVGSHLQSYQSDKQQLEASRQSDAERSRAVARLARDVSLAQSEPIATGVYTLDAEPGRVVLRVPRQQLLSEDGSLKPECRPLLEGLARVAQANKQSRLRVEDMTAPGDAIAASRLVAALTERGVTSERFEALAAASDDAAAPAPAPAPAAGAPAAGAPAVGAPEIWFAFSAP